MASLVGFMFLERQNVVADRDVQMPMGQVENAHSHEGQSVVRGGKIVLLGKLAVESAQIAVSVGDEKKLARVFGAANERRWTRSDYAEGKQGEELYMSNNQN